MIIRKTNLALLVGLLCAGSASAQDVYTFDEVVVSATRSEQNLKDVAASVATVTSDDLEKELAQDLQEAVKAEPGVSMKGNGRFGLSGFNIRGRDENYVKTLIDGVEQPGSYDPGADVMRKYNNTVEVDTLQHVEINKGPSSSVYGSDALAGAVVIRTKNPSDLLEEAGDDTHVGVKGGYYSADESFKSTATLANRTGDLETLLIFTHRDGHETATHSSGAGIEGRDRGQADPFDITSDNLLAKAYYQLNESHRIGLTGEIFNREAQGRILSNEGYTIVMPPPMPNFVYTRNSADDEDNRKRLTFEHSWQANNAVFDRLEWQITGQESESLHSTFDHTDMNGYRKRERNGVDKSWQLATQFNKAFELDNSYHELVYGVSYINNRFDLDYRDHKLDFGTVTDKSGEVPNAESDKVGIFIQDQAFFLDEQLVVNAGLRYDNFYAEPESTSSYKKAENDAVTAKLGTVYHWTEQFSTFAQVSQGFKAPTLQDLYYYYDTGVIYEPNADLKAEESISYETGLRFNNEFGRVAMSIFYNDYKNFIDERKIGDDATTGKEIWSKQNIANSEIYGAELSAQVALDRLVSAPAGTYTDMSLAYAQGEDSDTGKAIDTVAPLTAYMALGYDAPSKNYGGKLALQAVAGKEGDDWSNANDVDNAKAPGYVVIDVTAYYVPMKDLTVRGGLFNAFDTKYWHYADLAGFGATDQGIDRRTQPGRNWGIEAEYVF